MIIHLVIKKKFLKIQNFIPGLRWSPPSGSPKNAATSKVTFKKEDKKEEKESPKKGGLSKAQEKLPEGLRKAIAAKRKK
jgi:hypothetical protein